MKHPFSVRISETEVHRFKRIFEAIVAAINNNKTLIRGEKICPSQC